MKTTGYIISLFSIYLLAIAASVGNKSEAFNAYLIGGCVMSAIGMFLRWLSYQVSGN